MAEAETPSQVGSVFHSSGLDECVKSLDATKGWESSHHTLTRVDPKIGKSPKIP
jgi:hypothetical protein